MSLAVFPKLRRSWLAVVLTLLVLPVVLCLTPVLRPWGNIAVAGASRCEPGLPLDVAWQVIDGDPSPAGTNLTLVLTARTDLPAVRLDLLLPEHASLLSGAGTFQGALVRGQEARLTLRVSTRGAAKLQARVTAVTPRGLVFRRGATLDLGEDGRRLPRSDPGRLLSSPDGARQVREFPAVGQEVAP